jgi:hypothetical protein
VNEVVLSARSSCELDNLIHLHNWFADNRLRKVIQFHVEMNVERQVVDLKPTQISLGTRIFVNNTCESLQTRMSSAVTTRSRKVGSHEDAFFRSPEPVESTETGTLNDKLVCFCMFVRSFFSVYFFTVFPRYPLSYCLARGRSYDTGKRSGMSTLYSPTLQSHYHSMR